ncbi:MAG: T9SS type A sorting domain-containing protein [Saprospiraceae bacterium]|nr:T9SS type A sorting domain-containing protein [Saprospiraceae bacterium]
MAPGTYGYTITDANDCANIGQVTVTTSTCFITLEMNATPTSCPDLANGTATATIVAGGSGPFNYLWSNGATTSTISQITSGNYSVTVTDGSGCSEAGQVTVSSADLTPPSLILYNSVQVSLDGDGNVELEPSALVESANDNCSMVFYEISPAQVGCDQIGELQVTVTATDNSGNTTFKTTTVQVQDLLPPVIVCPNDIVTTSCQALSYPTPTAVDNCSTDISFNLESGPASGQVFPVGETTVFWSATDEKGNKSTCNFTVLVLSTLGLQTIADDVSCFGYSDGSIAVAVTGGQPPYTIVPSDTDQLPAGTYGIVVIDNAGCSLSSTTMITQPDELALNVSNITPATTGQSNGVIEFEVDGGVAPYAYAWLQGGVFLPNFNPTAAPAGMYQVRVQDANGCIFLSGLITVGSVSSSTEAELERRITLSPNPSTGLIYFQTDLIITEPIRLEIFDAAGRFLLRNKVDSPSKTIDLQAFGSGIYWVKIQLGEAVVWKKLVKI